MKNLEIIQKGYQHFSEGNVDAILEAFYPDIVWDECESFPFVKGDGIYHGPREILQNVFTKLPDYFDNFQIEVDELIDGGDKIVMKGHYAGTWELSRKKFRANATHV